MDGRAPGRAGRQSSERCEGKGVTSERTNGWQAEESSYRSVRAEVRTFGQIPVDKSQQVIDSASDR